MAFFLESEQDPERYVGLSMVKIGKWNYFRQGHATEQNLGERKEQVVLDIVCRSSLCRVDRSDKVKITGWDQNKELHEC